MPHSITQHNRGFTRTPKFGVSLQSKRGFTLLEMLVSIVIITVIMSVVLFNYSGLNDGVALNAATQELAISIRQAQSYGVAVKENSVGSGQFDYSYGVHFDPTDPTNYSVFVDSNIPSGGQSLVYDKGSGCGSGTTECIENVILRNGVKISQICVATTCPPAASIKSLDITFHRPSTDAHINFINTSGFVWSSGEQPTGKIVLISAKGTTRTVTVSQAGQISIQ